MTPQLYARLLNEQHSLDPNPHVLAFEVLPRRRFQGVYRLMRNGSRTPIFLIEKKTGLVFRSTKAGRPSGMPISTLQSAVETLQTKMRVSLANLPPERLVAWFATNRPLGV